MKYKIYQSDLIKNSLKDFQMNCKTSFEILKSITNSKDTTWNFYKYNIFNITSGSLLFYNLFKELNFYIRDYVGNDRPLWMQSWLNYHEEDDTLLTSLGNKKGFHGHDSLYHGYISIDPQNTITKFRNGNEIINKVGQVYIGPGRNTNKPGEYPFDHYVEIISPSISPRITIAFDLSAQVDKVLYSNYIPIL